MNAIRIYIILFFTLGFYSLGYTQTICNELSTPKTFDLTPKGNPCLSMCNRAWIWDPVQPGYEPGLGLEPSTAGWVEVGSHTSSSGTFYYTIHWNANYTGPATFRMDEYKWGSNWNGREKITHHYQEFCRVTPTSNVASLVASNNEVIKGTNLNLTVTKNSNLGCIGISSQVWYIKDKGASDATYQLLSQFNGQNSINYVSSVIGNKTFKVTYNLSCGYSRQNTIDVTFLPTCANNILSTIIAGSYLQSYGGSTFEIIDAGFPQGGGYKVNAGQTYEVVMTGVSDVWQNYQLSFTSSAGSNADNDITIIAPNRFTVNSNVVIGSYRIDLVKINDPLDRCPNIPAFKIFVGGNDVIFEEECSIVLPDYLIGPPPKIDGLTGIGDIILQHFSYTVSSSNEIIAKPGITLTVGAEIKLKIIENIIDSDDPDFNLNIVESTAYDDYGNIIASSRKYFDETGRETQTQQRNLSAGVILASAVLYDYAGRPSLRTLPAPVDYKTSDINACGNPALPWENLNFSYKSNFITTSSGANYSYLNFDGTKEGNPDLLSYTTPGTLGWYYSNNNIAGSSQYYSEPNNAKTNFPFTKMEFYNDGTKGMKTVAPPGDIYRSTSGHKHTSVSQELKITASDPDVIKYLQMWPYALPGIPTPTDLVEDAAKVNVIDEKGQSSFVITDKSGNTIITGMNASPQLLSFSFYDDANKLRYQVSPNGILAFSGSNFASIDKTKYEYDYRGFVIATTNADEGRKEYIYRKDGKVRFTQNASQRNTIPSRFSYLNYDKSGRLIETGEYMATGSNVTPWSSINETIIETISADGGLLNGFRLDRVFMYYDGENGSNTSPISQDFVIGRVSCVRKHGMITTWYNYDERGRVLDMIQYIDPLDKLFKMSYKYHQAGGIKELAYQADKTDAFYHYYEYDSDARLKYSYSGVVKPTYDVRGEVTNLASLQKHASYEYYLHGPLKRTEIADNNLQGIDYYYTIEGNLKSINNPSNMTDVKGGFKNDVFAMTLDYYVGDYTKSGTNIKSIQYPSTDNFDGNAKGVSWKNHLLSLASYSYTYNERKQLSAAAFGTPNYTNNSYTASSSYCENSLVYDYNGNLKSLQRSGTGGTIVNDFINKYNYTTNTNKLSGITGFSNYTYDDNGNLFIDEDILTGVQNKLQYNYTGKVISVTNENNVSKAEYYYDHLGQRICKKTFDASGQPVLYTWYIKDAQGNEISTYEQTSLASSLNQTEISLYGTSRLGRAYRNGSTYNYIYELKDQLGNVRATINRELSSGNVDVVSYFDYYPYGKVISGRSLYGSFGNRNGYQGEYAQFDPETGYDNFELRNYNSVIGRWNSPDPYNQYHSSYVGMGNNPVNSIDPDGGYSYAGAFWRNGFSKEGLKYSEKRGEWGYWVGSEVVENPYRDPNRYLDQDGFLMQREVVIATKPIYEYGKTWGSPYNSTLEGNTTYSSLQGEQGFYDDGWKYLVGGPVAVVGAAYAITYGGAVYAASALELNSISTYVYVKIETNVAAYIAGAGLLNKGANKLISTYAATSQNNPALTKVNDVVNTMYTRPGAFWMFGEAKRNMKD